MKTRISAKCCECKMEFAIALHELNIVKENKYCRNYDEQNLNARPQSMRTNNFTSINPKYVNIWRIQTEHKRAFYAIIRLLL